jgi:hypothetical protein
VQRIGDRRVRQVDVRLLSATDAELEVLVAEGKFREPLLHRIGELTLRVPRCASAATTVETSTPTSARGGSDSMLHRLKGLARDLPLDLAPLGYPEAVVAASLMAGGSVAKGIGGRSGVSAASAGDVMCRLAGPWCFRSYWTRGPW